MGVAAMHRAGAALPRLSHDWRAWTRWDEGRGFGSVVAAAVILPERMKGLARARLKDSNIFS